LAVNTAIPQEGALRRLKNRPEFIGAARGKRVGRSAFSLQANTRAIEEPGIGFTVTKQVGNSPQRNRIRRRLRAAAKACENRFEPQHDYVLVGRREALSMPFSQLVDELAASISKIHVKKKS
jgi:ribonuclease P protein component